MSSYIDNTQETIGIRDIIKRVTVLETELVELRGLLTALAGTGGDEGFEGNWYPCTLIHDSHFEAAMDELLGDIGDIPRDLPRYLTITVDYVALRQDYRSVEVGNQTYWYR